MARPKSSYPTELELQILKILWDRSPLPVREIRSALAEGGRELAHTSVITTLGIMVRKAYLGRSKQGNAFLFSPEISREAVSDGMLGDIVHRVFDDSPTALMASLFSTSDIDPEEIKQLRRLINRKAQEQSP
jgi:predicted transcriptional regulator